MILAEIREWGMFVMELGILLYVGMEYHYDKNKDEAKKQKKTKTTRKTTPNPSGGNIVEEVTEISEPMEEKK